MISDQLKRKLKDLRKSEIAIRFKRREIPPHVRLVWNEFFSLKLDPRSHAPVRYPLNELVQLEHEQLRQVFADYFAFVYFQYYRENGLSVESVYDPRLLALIGLPPGAGPEDVKRRFRELAKKYHPDTGGDSHQFVQLMDVYGQLTR
jgi:hypothetical protein